LLDERCALGLCWEPPSPDRGVVYEQVVCERLPVESWRMDELVASSML
jgi:hypothetical protein